MGLAAGGVIASVLGDSWTAFAAPSDADGVISAALQDVGKTLSDLQSTIMVEEPWHSYAGDWCAVYGSWLLRGAGGSYVTLASQLYGEGTPVSTPLKGDIIYYPKQTGTDGHVGLVTDVVGSAIKTVEGNTHIHPWPSAQVTAYNSPTYPIRNFSRPSYTAAQTENDMAIGFVSSGIGYAIAGGGVGQAAWLEVNSTIAASMVTAGVVKGWVAVDSTTWNSMKSKFQAPIPVVTTP